MGSEVPDINYFSVLIYLKSFLSLYWVIIKQIKCVVEKAEERMEGRQCNICTE
jgi:hypothetical protein